MKHSIHTQIEIDAPVSTVWAALMAFDEYKNWNPFITHATLKNPASGAPSVGAILDIKIKRQGKNEQPYQVEILEIEPLKKFRWLGHFLITGLCDGDHFFELQPIGDNKTLLIHRENFSGLFVPFVLKNFDANFTALNNALKQYIEKT